MLAVAKMPEEAGIPELPELVMQCKCIEEPGIVTIMAGLRVATMVELFMVASVMVVVVKFALVISVVAIRQNKRVALVEFEITEYLRRLAV